MDQLQHAVYQAFLRVDEFLTTHADDLGPIATGAARATFDGVVAALPTLAATQYGAQETAVGCTKRRNALRETLRFGHMRPIADIARITLTDTPESVQFRLPWATVPDGRLVAAADAMATRAAPYTTTFTAHALPNDFIAQLQAAADAVRQAVADRATARNAWVHATADVQEQLALGRGALRVLDSLIVARLRDTNAPLIEAWNQTKHVIAKPGVPRGTIRAAEPDITPVEPTPNITPVEPRPDITPVETVPQAKAA